MYIFIFVDCIHYTFFVNHYIAPRPSYHLPRPFFYYVRLFEFLFKMHWMNGDEVVRYVYLCMWSYSVCNSFCFILFCSSLCLLFLFSYVFFVLFHPKIVVLQRHFFSAFNFFATNREKYGNGDETWRKDFFFFVIHYQIILVESLMYFNEYFIFV